MDSRRDDLIERVRYGEMTPAEAEAEAARLNLRPLEYRPKPEDFDPMKEPFWTLPMAVAWIVYRTPDEVREWWDAYRTECRDWHFRKWRVGVEGEVYEGHFLEQRSPASLDFMKMTVFYYSTSAYGVSPKMHVTEAIDALVLSLREGLIDATGISTVGTRETIPVHAWLDVVGSPLRGAARALRYEQVLVGMKAVTGLWPATKPVPKPILPETMPPTGAGYMPLYCAAQWIATSGGKQNFDPSTEEIWKAAFDDLLARISSDQVKVIGLRNGEREPVPGHHFAACLVDYPFSATSLELTFSEKLYLCSYPYVDEKHWNSGFDDSLRNRQGVRWSQLLVLKEDVARIWPFTLEAPAGSGAPGRPSSMHLVEAQFNSRCQSGEVASTITQEAELLAEWLKKAHPDKPRLTRKTISNKLRSVFHQYQNARK